jgi:nucleotide-binding universal stress UspA family protein
MIALKNILVPVDFGEASDVALKYGRDLARSYGARLHVLHVVEDLMTRYAVEYPMNMPDVQQDVERTARQQVDSLVTREDRTQLNVAPVVRTSNMTANTIVNYAGEERIDLIVMGTHGRTGVSHLLMGSVAERVVRTAPCPVLTVRNPEREFIAPDALVGKATA